MKFAKTLEDLMVPEWKSQYVQYKVGKKKIKENTQRIHSASPSPAISSLRLTASRVQAPVRSPSNGSSVGDRGNKIEEPAEQNRPRGLSILHKTASLRGSVPSTSTNALERSPLHDSSYPQEISSARPWSYGSIQSTPPVVSAPAPLARPPSLHLPDPMQPMDIGQTDGLGDMPLESRWSDIGGHMQPTTPTDGRSSKCILSRPQTSRSDEAQHSNSQKPFLRRMLTLGRNTITTPVDKGLSITEVQTKAEKEFLKWLLQERHRCEEFYSSREKEALTRYDEMQEQLDIMRERWFKAKHNIPFEEDDVEDLTDNDITSEAVTTRHPDDGHLVAHYKRRVGWKSVTDAVSGFARPHPTTAKVNIMADGRQSPGLRDYERKRPCRRPLNNPAHRVAKRKLKKAYIEYYHGLEMLKSYVTVNRECLRKITKKFDKASGMRTSHRFMTEYVDKSYFGGANNKLDDLLNDTESLFARFFERGNRKEASSRLRSRENKTLYYSSVWRSGFYLGLALIIAAYGLYDGVKKIYDETNPVLALKTSYLLQVHVIYLTIHI
ncbi:SPX domain-containing protein [Geopyxis carbonaria]|nr:SPX domain-containing protein [Geopyxis carbonaria]